MLFRQLFDPTSSTYTYLLGDPATGDAVLIDPVFEQHERDAALVRELDLTLRYALDTHVHADHVTGAWLLKQELGARIALAATYGAQGVDRPLRDGDIVEYGHRALDVRATPGHTAGCLTYVDHDAGLVFTGDALLIRGAGRTDFQAGSASTLFHSIRDQILSLPDDFTLYPAHDYRGRTASSVGEERAHNPRIGGQAREEDFVGYMNNLGLPHPKKIAEALPANLRVGEPADGKAPEKPTWGPVVRTYGGVLQIEPEWVARHRARVRLLDVRSPAELDGELSHIAGAQSIPLDELRERVAEVPTDRPVVVVCQSGRRSAMATSILEKAGVTQVANLAGGMLAWRELGLPTAARR